MDRRDVLEHQVGTRRSAREAVDYPRRPIAKLLVDPFVPEVSGLIDVRIS
jgi:hypothetical protein